MPCKIVLAVFCHICRFLRETLAQQVEQLPFKQRVTGSSPVRLISFFLLLFTGASLLGCDSLRGRDSLGGLVSSLQPDEGELLSLVGGNNRDSALKALWLLGRQLYLSDRGFKALKKATEDDDWAFRLTAMGSLIEQGGGASGIAPLLRRTLRDANWQIRYQAVVELRKRPELLDNSVELGLLKGLLGILFPGGRAELGGRKDLEPDRVATTLPIYPISERETHIQLATRLYAIEILGLLGSRAAEAADLLAAQLRDRDSSIVLSSLVALSKIGSINPDVKRALLELMDNTKDQEVLRFALWTAGELKFGESLPKLVDYLHSNSPPLRKSAIKSLAKIGSVEALEALKRRGEALKELARNEDGEKRRSAINALEELGKFRSET